MAVIVTNKMSSILGLPDPKRTQLRPGATVVPDELADLIRRVEFTAKLVSLGKLTLSESDTAPAPIQEPDAAPGKPRKKKRPSDGPPPANAEG